MLERTWIWCIGGAQNRHFFKAPPARFGHWGILSRSTGFFFFLSESRSVVSDSLRPHGLYSLWNSPGQNTGVGSLSLLQGDLPNPEIEPRSPALQADSLPAEPQGKLVKNCYFFLSRTIFLPNRSQPYALTRQPLGWAGFPGPSLPMWKLRHRAACWALSRVSPGAVSGPPKGPGSLCCGPCPGLSVPPIPAGSGPEWGQLGQSGT